MLTWMVGTHWHGPVFRIVWIGFWRVSYDMTDGHAYYRRWPYMRVDWNEA
jgi:hypothetical protein